MKWRLPSLNEVAVPAPHQSLSIFDQTDNTRPEVVAIPASTFNRRACSQRYLHDNANDVSIEHFEQLFEPFLCNRLDFEVGCSMQGTAVHLNRYGCGQGKDKS